MRETPYGHPPLPALNPSLWAPVTLYQCANEQSGILLLSYQLRALDCAYKWPARPLLNWMSLPASL